MKRTPNTELLGAAGTLPAPPTPADRYFYAWALVIPIASILVIPFVQGTTPANLFALTLLFPPIALMVMSFDGAKNF